MTEGQRNHNSFILAMAFNDFGVSQNVASIVLNQYQSDGFTATEIKNAIKSAYSNTQNFNTKYYEDEEKVNQIQQKLRRGDSKKAIRQELKESGLDNELIDSVVETAEENNSIKFWTKSDKGIVKALPLIFKKFLEANGFYKFCPDDQKVYVFEYADLIDIYFIEDTADESYLYYENCAIKITKDEVTPIDYLELDGYVWKNHIINRVYKKCEVGKSDYRTFISQFSEYR